MYKALKFIVSSLALFSFVEQVYAFNQLEVASNINAILFAGEEQVIEVSDLNDVNLTNGGIHIYEVSKLNTLNSACITEKAAFKDFGLARADKSKRNKRFRKFMKQHLDKDLYNKDLFKLILAPRSASVESVNCGSDASKSVISLNYLNADKTKVYKIEFSLDGFE